MAATRARAAEATVVLPAERAGILVFEDFVDELDFLEPEEARRLRLAGGEIFDNLVRHAAPLEGGAATLRAARRGGRAQLFFYFKSSRFAAYAARCGDHEPYFDSSSRRWHGMGLRMCRNLARRLVLRAGDLVDRIVLVF